MGDFSDLFKPARFSNVAELMDVDQADPLEDDDFDTQLWKLLCSKVDGVESTEGLPVEVVAYFASRLMEWEVGNGGFAQAAYNIPDWFELAARGYEAIGHAAAAARVREAWALAQGDLEPFSFLKRRRPKIHKIFSAFQESRLNVLTEGLDEIGWWATDDRLAFARRHRDAFRRVGS